MKDCGVVGGFWVVRFSDGASMALYLGTWKPACACPLAVKEVVVVSLVRPIPSDEMSVAVSVHRLID
jgi:hypothetical protein